MRPELKVIVTSAYGKETVDASFRGLHVEHFIRKPFQLDDIVGLFARLTERSNRTIVMAGHDVRTSNAVGLTSPR